MLIGAAYGTQLWLTNVNEMNCTLNHNENGMYSIFEPKTKKQKTFLQYLIINNVVLQMWHAYVMHRKNDFFI